MNFLDLFAGIGGFRFGMERAGHKCIGFCEIDKYARASYQAIHDTEGEIDYKDITEVTNDERVFPITGEDEKLNTNGEIKQIGNIGKSDNFGGNPQVTRVYDINGISPTLNTMQGGGREPKIFLDNKIRKLTPRECWRLQGFPDWAFDKAQELNSNSQLYKQAGNSVTVNVIEEIAKRIK